MKLHPKDTEEVQIDMSPMIDMVFLLLIFFIVAATLIEEKVKIDNLPTAKHATIPENKEDRVVVSIKDVDKIYFGPRETHPLTLDQLQQYLRAAREKDPKVKVFIRCAGDIKYKVTEKVATACGNAGVTNLIYAAHEEKIED
jgi:biopolymer transport protein ExbD